MIHSDDQSSQSNTIMCMVQKGVAGRAVAYDEVNDQR